MIKRFFSVLFLLTLFSILTFAQKPKPKPFAQKKPPAGKPQAATLNEKESLDKALAETDPARKIAALQKFTTKFPSSSERTRALEIIVSLQAQMADQKLQAGEQAAGIELFKRAVADAPNPVSDKLFSEVVLQFPTNLFYRSQQAAAIEVAKLIEEKISGNPKQLLGLATFYLGTENADEAQRIANKAIALDANLPAAYQTLGLANRLAFRLDESAAAYARALELDPESAVSKRSLAEMKRATGKADEAVKLYRQLLEKNPEDAQAQTGLTLSLFNAGMREEAETQLGKSLEANPNNLSLLVGAAYWYAANRQGDKALEYAQKAVAVEPRYTWARIAMARAYLVQGNPLDAEKELMAARQYGNFPTLTYEIASARLAAGFYEEAAQELRKTFVVKDDVLEVRLGNRVEKQAKNFTELVELERRASIFEPLAADNPENAEKLKALLRLHQTLSAENPGDDAVAQAVNEFVGGDDKARIHRELYAATRLLQSKKNLPKALELTQSAIRGVDEALDIPSPAAAVMADELYESRTIAMTRSEVVVVPQIPRQTLLAILRGRIEEISGWALYQQNKPQEAVVRLKRAVGILPEKSAWWRSSTWKLGAALDAAGKQTEALEEYIKNYQNSEPDVVKYSIIEALYQKVHGKLDGLNEKIGARPVNPNTIAAVSNETVAQNTEAATKTEPTPQASPSVTLEASPQATLTPVAEPTPEVSATPKTEESPTIEVKASPSPIVEPTPEKKETPEPEKTPEVKPEATPATSPTPQAIPESTEIKASEISEKPSSEPQAKSTPKPLFEPIIITVPAPETSKTPKPDQTAKNTSDPVNKEEAAENKSSETSKSATPLAGSGETRPRLLPVNPPAKSAKPETEACELTVSQESVSILSEGGNLGILIGFRGEGDLSKITPISGSPDDIEVTLEPEVGKQSNRAFFVIKSISASKGVYTVTFDSPCGKKEVLVKVR